MRESPEIILVRHATRHANPARGGDGLLHPPGYLAAVEAGARLPRQPWVFAYSPTPRTQQTAFLMATGHIASGGSMAAGTAMAASLSAAAHIRGQDQVGSVGRADRIREWAQGQDPSRAPGAEVLDSITRELLALRPENGGVVGVTHDTIIAVLRLALGGNEIELPAPLEGLALHRRGAAWSAKRCRGGL